MGPGERFGVTVMVHILFTNTRGRQIRLTAEVGFARSVDWVGFRKWIYIAPLLQYLTLKALRYGSHSVTCKLHRTCLYLVSIHQMAHPQTEVADIELQHTTHLSTPKG